MSSKIEPANFPPLPTNPNTQVETKRNKQNKRRGWKHEWKAVDKSKLEQLVDRDDPVRQLIDHNTQGLTALYFMCGEMCC